jgi:hypothetical protein
MDRVGFTNGAAPSNTISRLSSDWFSGDFLETLPAARCSGDPVNATNSDTARRPDPPRWDGLIESVARG